MELDGTDVRFLRAAVEMLEDSPSGTATITEVLDAIGEGRDAAAQIIDRLQVRGLIEFGGGESFTVTQYGEKILDEIDRQPAGAA
jgi:predicted transcriptional regulator